jgi:phenylacetate-coenzyme A ligase PaaK-like adenylate-forming protein
MSRLWTLLLTIFHFIAARWRWRTLRGQRLRRYQEQRARRIVRYAHARSPFYRRHWAGRSLDDWRSLPTVDKQLMMGNFDEFNTAGLTRHEAMEVALHAERSRDFSPTLRGYTVGLSSGTSGHRGIFLAGAWEQATWAGCILSRTLHELRPRKLRVAFFLRSNSNLYEKVGGVLIKFRFFDLMLPIEQAVERLNAFKPHIVVGPPSLLGFLADARERGTLDIQPERLVSVAEVLEPQDAGRLQAVFNAPVHQIYQCTEGLLAISCREGSLHIQEDLVVMQLESLDDGGRWTMDGGPQLTDDGRWTMDDGQPTPEGERPEVGGSVTDVHLLPSTVHRPPSTVHRRVSPTVTDLWRTTQPIIRYRLNDVLRVSGERCACGSPFRVIEAIEGRCDDILYFQARDGGERPFFPDTIRRMVLLAGPGIEDYYAVQERPGHLRIHLAVAPGASFAQIAEEVSRHAQESIAQYNCMPADLHLEQGLPERPPDAKRRRVVRIRSEHDPAE